MQCEFTVPSHPLGTAQVDLNFLLSFDLLAGFHRIHGNSMVPFFFIDIQVASCNEHLD